MDECVLVLPRILLRMIKECIVNTCNPIFTKSLFNEKLLGVSVLELFVKVSVMYHFIQHVFIIPVELVTVLLLELKCNVRGKDAVTCFVLIK